MGLVVTFPPILCLRKCNRHIHILQLPTCHEAQALRYPAWERKPRRFGCCPESLLLRFLAANFDIVGLHHVRIFLWASGLFHGKRVRTKRGMRQCTSLLTCPLIVIGRMNNASIRDRVRMLPDSSDVARDASIMQARLTDRLWEIEDLIRLRNHSLFLVPSVPRR